MGWCCCGIPTGSTRAGSAAPTVDGIPVGAVCLIEGGTGSVQSGRIKRSLTSQAKLKAVFGLDSAPESGSGALCGPTRHGSHYPGTTAGEGQPTFAPRPDCNSSLPPHMCSSNERRTLGSGRHESWPDMSGRSSEVVPDRVKIRRKWWLAALPELGPSRTPRSQGQPPDSLVGCGRPPLEVHAGHRRIHATVQPHPGRDNELSQIRLTFSVISSPRRVWRWKIALGGR
jgi:hypothetical protein